MTKTIRISERAYSKITANCSFGEVLADVLDRLLFGNTANNTQQKQRSKQEKVGASTVMISRKSKK